MFGSFLSQLSLDLSVGSCRTEQTFSLMQNISLIIFFVADLDIADSRFGLPVGDSMEDRGSSSIFGQERWMHNNQPCFESADDSRWQQIPIRTHNPKIHFLQLLQKITPFLLPLCLIIFSSYRCHTIQLVISTVKLNFIGDPFLVGRALSHNLQIWIALAQHLQRREGHSARTKEDESACPADRTHELKSAV